MKFLEKAGKKLINAVSEEMSMEEYLALCKKDPLVYASAAERLLYAIGEAELVDTRQNERLARIFMNETIPMYKSFSKIYGLEDTIKNIVSFVKHSAQGLEEKKQILYLLGPVGSSKSTIVQILKRLMESVPFYALKGSPIFESPLGLIDAQYSSETRIPERYLNHIASPWAIKRLQEFDGDLTKFRVVKMYPSEIHQVAISHTEPGDENNQDISSLVGKLDIRRVGDLAQDDPDCYSFSGGLCLGNRGIAEYSEMFKAPIKSLNPLLEATQSGFYKGTEAIAAIPFDGIIIAHSNESEWQKFKQDKRNEALIDRIYIVKVPYCLRYTEEEKIYEKMLKESSLSNAPCAPKTLENLAQFSVMSRLVDPKNSELDVKMKVYNGENLKHKNVEVKSVYEYRKDAHENSNIEEGFNGISTRFAFKALAKTFNHDTKEVAANPFHLMSVISTMVRAAGFTQEVERSYLSLIEGQQKEYLKFLDGEIKKAFIESYEEYGQNLFDKYCMYADHFLNEEDYRDGMTGMLMTTKDLDKFLQEIETPAGVRNAKDFRNEVVKFVLRYKSQHDGVSPRWTAYNKMREVLEAKIFSNLDDMLPIISSSAQASKDEAKRHEDFVERMAGMGYTRNQVQLLVDWYVRSSR